MSRLRTASFLLLVLFVCVFRANADDRWETLRAINWVENPTNHTRVGRFGELGPYQFRPTTWRMHTRKPFNLAAQRETADEVAVLHYEWIKSRLERAGVDPNAFNIAMAWNSGVDNVIAGRAPSVSYNYAERVVNLVHSFKAKDNDAPVVAEAAPAQMASSEVAAISIGTLDQATIHFSVTPGAPKFEVELVPPAPIPVIYTVREPVLALAPISETAPMFVFSPSSVTLKPTIGLLPTLRE